MITGSLGSQAIYVAAKLGIADLLVNGAKNVEELAAAAEADAPSLYRVLRALASLGVFTERDDKTFELNSTAELLRSDSPCSLRDLGHLLWRGLALESLGSNFIQCAHRKVGLGPGAWRGSLLILRCERRSCEDFQPRDDQLVESCDQRRSWKPTTFPEFKLWSTLPADMAGC